jgi:hypothetical protein
MTITKQLAIMRRLTVLSLPLHLVFHGYYYYDLYMEGININKFTSLHSISKLRSKKLAGTVTFYCWMFKLTFK